MGLFDIFNKEADCQKCRKVKEEDISFEEFFPVVAADGLGTSFEV